MQDRAVGQSVPGLVMVGDHHLHAQLPSQLHLLDRGDAAIDGDQELGPTLRELLDVVGAQPVPVRDPVRDQPVALGAQLAQRADQDRRRADAVDVEVAMDGDPPAVANRSRRRARPRRPSTGTPRADATRQLQGIRAPPPASGSRGARASPRPARSARARRRAPAPPSRSTARPHMRGQHPPRSQARQRPGRIRARIRPLVPSECRAPRRPPGRARRPGSPSAP